MIWLISEEREIFQDIDKLKAEYRLDELFIFPTREKIVEAICSENNIGILSSIEPDYKVWGKIFPVVEISSGKADNGFLTSQEIRYEFSQSLSLRQKLGLEVIDWKVCPTLADMGGADNFISFVKELESNKKKGIKSKPIIFVGMAGCGKSRGAEAIAGEWEIPLIDLHISALLESKNPIKSLRRVFEYLEKSKIECVIRMDEIEQMLSDKGMIGELLRIFNGLNKPNGYNIEAIVIATANNIKVLIEEIPQFFRHGRWNEKFFVSFPTEQQAIDIMNYYASRYMVTFNNYSLKTAINHIIEIADTEYDENNLASNENKFIYAPSEIDFLFEKLSQSQDSKMDDMLRIRRAIIDVVPLQKTASQGTLDMYAEVMKLGFKDLGKIA